MSAFLSEYRAAATTRVVGMSEGTPDLWTALGLQPVSSDLVKGLGPVAELAAAWRPGARSEKPGAIVAHPCIGRSGGDAAKLPVSVIWEVALALAVAKALGSTAALTICVYEETVQHPQRKAEFLELAEPLTGALRRLATRVGVPAVFRAVVTAPEVPLPPTSEMYGVFTPWTLSRYPLGFPNEHDVLYAFACYCARYHEALLADEAAWIVEGIHLSKAVLTGLPASGTYVAMVPLPDPGNGAQLVQDAGPARRVTLERTRLLPADWWPEKTMAKALGVGIRELCAGVASDLRVELQ